MKMRLASDGDLRLVLSDDFETDEGPDLHLVLSPVVDIARDPRWGRIEETFGEDPFLVSRMGVAAVLGMMAEIVVAPE